MKKVLVKALVLDGVLRYPDPMEEVDLSSLSKGEVERLEDKGFFAAKAKSQTAKNPEEKQAEEE